MHVVFATEGRRSCLADGLRDRLYGLIGGIAREHGLPALAVGGTSDHIHVLISLPRTISIAKAVQVLKSCSSKWIHETFPHMKAFAWQEGYGAFSIGVAQRDVTVKYIQTQAGHHQRYSFAEEMTTFVAVQAERLVLPSPERMAENSLGLQSRVTPNTTENAAG